MKADLRITAEAAPDGRTVLTRLSSGPPLTARSTVDGVTLVTSAGGPLGGDEVVLRVRVGSGARLRIGAAAASVVQPDRRGRVARCTLDADVQSGGLLVWAPQPTVVAAGADYEVRQWVRLAPDARLDLTERTVLGRHGEVGGRVRFRLDVTVDGAPLLRQSSDWGEGAPGGWAGPAGLGGARVVGMRLLAGRRPGQPTVRGVARRSPARPVAAFPVAACPAAACPVVVSWLPAGALLVTALGRQVVDVDRTLATVAQDETAQDETAQDETAEANAEGRHVG